MIYEAYITSGMSPQKASASKGTPAALDGTLEPTTATSSNTSTLIMGLEYIDVNNINDTAYFDSIRGDMAGSVSSIAKLKLVKRLAEIRVLLGETIIINTRIQLINATPSGSLISSEAISQNTSHGVL